MRLEHSHLKSHLEKQLAPLYVLVGDEPLAHSESLDAIRLAARKAGADERTSFIVERNFNWQQIQQFAQALSLFSSMRILEIHIPSGKPGLDGGKVLVEMAQNTIPETTSIVVLPSLERDAKNSTWFSALQRAAVVIELDEIAPSSLPQWISKRLAIQGQSADTATLGLSPWAVAAGEKGLGKIGVKGYEQEATMPLTDIKQRIAHRRTGQPCSKGGRVCQIAGHV